MPAIVCAETRGSDGRAIAVSDTGYSPSIALHSFWNSSWLVR